MSDALRRSRRNESQETHEPDARPAPADPAIGWVGGVGNWSFASQVAHQDVGVQREARPAPARDAALQRGLAGAVQRRQLMRNGGGSVAPAAVALADRLIGMLEIFGPVDYDGVMEAIHRAPAAQRRTALETQRIRDLVRERIAPAFALTVMAALLEGSQQWKNPPSNQFFDYFVTTRGSGRLPSTATMNCWEVILYAAYSIGQISASWIERFYVSALAETDPNGAIWRQLGWSSALPTVPPAVASPGQLLFFHTGGPVPGHVALSIGGGEAISLWNQPNGDSATQRIRITDLAGTVHIGNPPW